MFRKKAVCAATLKKWSGNEKPIFRKNKDSMKQLEELVKELLEKCTFPHVGFDAQPKITHRLQQNLLTLNKVCSFACKERIEATQKWPIKNTS